MPDEIPTSEKAVYLVFEMIALGFFLGAVDSFMRGDAWWKWTGALIAGIVFMVAGVKWPKLKEKIGPRISSTVERIASKRRYSWSIYALIAIIVLATVGFPIYRHCHPARQISTYNPPTSLSSTPDIIRPTITWADPAPIAFGTALSLLQLNATVNVNATPSYNHQIGEVLPVGRYDLTVIFTPTDTKKYSQATQTIHLVVKRAPRSLISPPNPGSAAAPPQTKPAPTVPTPATPPPLAGIRIANQEQVVSANSALPYGLKVVIVTDKDVSPTALVVKFSGEIGGSFAELPGGAQMYVCKGYLVTDRTIEVIEWGSPAFTTERGIVLTVYSKTYIRAIDLGSVPYNWPRCGDLRE